MCGIVGLFPYPIKKECDDLNCRVRLAIQKILFSETLVALEPRGKDSSGIGLVWNDKKTVVLKQPVPAHTFARDDGSWNKDFVNPKYPDVNFSWLMSLWDRGANTENYLRAALGHVRKGTQGSPYDAHNNHPIVVPPTGELKDDSPLAEGTIVGVHNGGIQNDKSIFNRKKFNRIGEVDSEVIFQLMKEYRDDFTVENLSKTFDDLEGAYAVMAYNNANPNKIGCIREVRPMEAAYSPELGALIIVSERKYLDKAWHHYDRWRVREANRAFTFTDDDGKLKSLGKVGDLFPHISYSWYGGETPINSTSSVESGVFVLDLDTEVSDTTKPEDLIKVTKKYKKAGSSCLAGSHRQGNVYQPTVKDNRSAAATKEKKVDVDVDDVKTNVIDSTNYDVKEEETDIEIDASEEGIQVEVDLIDLEDSEEEEEEEVICPFNWKERIEFGQKSLYGSQQDNKNLLLNQDSDKAKESLNKYLIPCKDGDEASILLAYMYDLLYPEGYGVGYEEGYEQAFLEQSVIMEPEEDESAKLSEQLKMAHKLIEKLVEKKNRASKLLEAVRPILSTLLKDTKVIDAAGEVDRDALNSLAKFSGVTDYAKCSDKIMNVVSRAKSNK